MIPMLTILTDLETLIGGAISNTFGQMFVPMLAIIIFLGMAVYMRASFENVIVFMVPLIAILAMYLFLPISIVIGVIIIGSIVIFFGARKIFGV